jgi:hypothetical protein
MLRLAPSHGWPRAAFALELKRGPLRAANDNPAKPTEADAVLAAALRLFAANGLSAAVRAEELALDAIEAGDREAEQRWLAVCRTLDRQRARQLLARLRQKGHSGLR